MQQTDFFQFDADYSVATGVAIQLGFTFCNDKGSPQMLQTPQKDEDLLCHDVDPTLKDPNDSTKLTTGPQGPTSPPKDPTFQKFCATALDRVYDWLTDFKHLYIRVYDWLTDFKHFIRNLKSENHVV